MGEKKNGVGSGQRDRGLFFVSTCSAVDIDHGYVYVDGGGAFVVHIIPRSPGQSNG